MIAGEVGESSVGAILFTDLVGFTEFNAVAGDVRALEILEAQTAMMSAALARCPDARIVKELGDGVMVWFGTAPDALAGAIDVLSRVRSGRQAGTFPLAMRLGLHHGEALRRGDDLVGLTVSIAARVCDLAGPGELLVSEALIRRCDRVPTEVEPIGPTRVRGVEEPIWLHRVVL